MKNILLLVIFFVFFTFTNSLLAQQWDKSIKLYNQTTFYEKIVSQGITGNSANPIKTESTHLEIQ